MTVRSLCRALAPLAAAVAVAVITLAPAVAVAEPTPPTDGATSPTPAAAPATSDPAEAPPTSDPAVAPPSSDPAVAPPTPDPVVAPPMSDPAGVAAPDPAVAPPMSDPAGVAAPDPAEAPPTPDPAEAPPTPDPAVAPSTSEPDGVAAPDTAEGATLEPEPLLPIPVLPGRAVECDVVTAPVPFEATVVASGIRVHPCLESRVTALVDAAARDGVSLTGGGWRSHQRQIELRRAHCGTSDYAIWEMSPGRCRPPTARPGRSRHERGLAIDFDNCSTRATACYRWLDDHAAGYGLHNLPSEPWHWSVDGH